MHKKIIAIYALAALGLLVILLSLSAVLLPFNNSELDEGYYVYHGQRIHTENDWLFTHFGRQFTYYGAVLVDVVFPGRYQFFWFFHLFCFYMTALSIFHLMRRFLPGKDWVGFIIAAVYLGYLPSNPYVASTWVNNYVIALLLCVVTVVCAVEFVYQTKKWSYGFLLMAMICGYAATRILESGIVIIPIVPAFLILVAFGWKKRLIIALSSIWVSAGYGAMQFLIPFFSKSETVKYQSKAADQNSIGELAKRFLNFHTISLPHPEWILDIQKSYFFPSLITGLLFILTSWLFIRRFPEKANLLTIKQAFYIIVIAFATTSMMGIVHIYANVVEGREQVFAAPGQAAVLVSLIIIASFAAQSVLQIKAGYTTICTLSIYFMMSGNWYYQHQQFWLDQTQYRITSDERANFFNEIVSLIPKLKDDTMILLLECDQYEALPLSTLLSTNYTLIIRYLYDRGHDSGVQMTTLDKTYFAIEGLDYLRGEPEGTHRGTPQFYKYDQMVVLRCTPSGLVIESYFPTGYLIPEDAHTDQYDPYSRIIHSFIDKKNTIFLAR